MAACVGVCCQAEAVNCKDRGARCLCVWENLPLSWSRSLPCNYIPEAIQRILEMTKCVAELSFEASETEMMGRARAGRVLPSDNYTLWFLSETEWSVITAIERDRDRMLNGWVGGKIGAETVQIKAAAIMNMANVHFHAILVVEILWNTIPRMHCIITINHPKCHHTDHLTDVCVLATQSWPVSCVSASSRLPSFSPCCSCIVDYVWR